MSILKPRKDAEITVDFGVAKIKRVDGGFVYNVVLINLKKGLVVVKTVNSSIINPSFVFICFWIIVFSDYLGADFSFIRSVSFEGIY